MAQQAWQVLIAMKLVWFRVLMYFFIPTAGMFLTQTETWSGDTWDHTHPFLKWRLLLQCCIPGILNIIAFIDSSLSRAKEEIKNGKPPTISTGQTDFLTKAAPTV